MKIGYQKPQKTPATIWHVFVFFVVLVGMNIAVTQAVASSFFYDTGLGLPIIENFYQPFSWVEWYFNFYDQYPDNFDKAFAYVSLVGLVGIYIYVTVIFTINNTNRAHKTIHGTAHFATPQEIEQTGLTSHQNKEVVYVGGWEDKYGRLHYLKHSGPEHILSIGPTRSGKDVVQVIPTLLSWSKSALILDLKGDLWALTSGWRQDYAKNKVLKFEPTCIDNTGARFNSLSEIRLKSPYEISDAQNIADVIVDPHGKGLESHWDKTSHAFLVGAILHCLYQNKFASLTTVANIISSHEITADELLDEMQTTSHLPNGPHPYIASAAMSMKNKDERERSGVISTADSFLTIYKDPLIEKNISVSDFKIADLMNHETPVSLYLLPNPAHRKRLRPLMRLMISQIFSRLTEKMELDNNHVVTSYRHRLLLMLNEFTSLGRLEVFQENLAYIAGYGIKAYLLVQDTVQLNNVYGRDESIFSNCHIKTAYAPNKPETAQLLSTMTGTTTIVKKQITSSGNRFGTKSGNLSESVQETQRPLLTVDEVLRLPSPIKDKNGRITKPGDMLIFVAGHAPIYGKQTLYFQDPVFSKRAMTPAVKQSDKLIKSNDNDGKSFNIPAFKLP